MCTKGNVRRCIDKYSQHKCLTAYTHIYVCSYCFYSSLLLASQEREFFFSFFIHTNKNARIRFYQRIDRNIYTKWNHSILWIQPGMIEITLYHTFIVHFIKLWWMITINCGVSLSIGTYCFMFIVQLKLHQNQLKANTISTTAHIQNVMTERNNRVLN